jgi:hypothetical protein
MPDAFILQWGNPAPRERAIGELLLRQARAIAAAG